MLRDAENRSIPHIKGGEENPSIHTKIQVKKKRCRGTPPWAYF
jgi:hypothetical protein